jgi:hypothetical protein
MMYQPKGFAADSTNLSGAYGRPLLSSFNPSQWSCCSPDSGNPVRIIPLPSLIGENSSYSGVSR